MPNPNIGNPMPNIRKVGLRAYLDDTKEQHKGYGYDDWRKNQDMNSVALGVMFGVHKNTIRNWRYIERDGYVEPKNSQES
jgi:hypothetical protein